MNAASRRRSRAVLLVLALSAMAPGTMADEIRVDAAWSRALPPVSANGAAYLTIENASAHPDALLGVSTPAAARAEMHDHVLSNGVMSMRRVDSIPLVPGRVIAMAPGGMHVMLIDLARPLRPGDRFPLTLRFAHEPAKTVEVEVFATGHDPGAGEHRKTHGHATHGNAPMSSGLGNEPAMHGHGASGKTNRQ